MPARGNNGGTFAEYVELEIAIDEYSPNAYLFKRLDSETNKPVSERSWYVGIPIPNKGNGKRLSLSTYDLSLARRKAQQKVLDIMADPKGSGKKNNHQSNQLLLMRCLYFVRSGIGE